MCNIYDTYYIYAYISINWFLGVISSRNLPYKKFGFSVKCNEKLFIDSKQG